MVVVFILKWIVRGQPHYTILSLFWLFFYCVFNIFRKGKKGGFTVRLQRRGKRLSHNAEERRRYDKRKRREAEAKRRIGNEDRLPDKI